MTLAALFVVSVCLLGYWHEVTANCHGAHCIPSPNEVDNAIEHGIDSHFWNDNLCLEILLVNCDQHVTKGDEKICGSNGHEYPDHCHFAHARCMFLHLHGHKLTVGHHGACSYSGTDHYPTAPIFTTTPATTLSAPWSPTWPPVYTSTTESPRPPSTASTTTLSGPWSPTWTTLVNSQGPATQVSLSTSTVDPMPDIIQNVFCSNIGYINCANEVIDIFCGSNGKIYPNMCEISKDKCSQPQLTAVDLSHCIRS